MSGAACPVDAPVCDAETSSCRPCQRNEDAPCQARAFGSASCWRGRCVVCIPSETGPAQSPTCERLSQPTGVVSPVCDQGTCRPCTRHAECASGVCATDDSNRALGIPRGSCVPASRVIVVDESLCRTEGPVYCSIQPALDALRRERPYVLLRRQLDPQGSSGLLVHLLDTLDYTAHVIGPLADLSLFQASELPHVYLGGRRAPRTLLVTRGRVRLDGLYIRDAGTGVSCRGTESQVQVFHSFISESDLAVRAEDDCQLVVDASWLGRGPEQTYLRGVRSNYASIEILGADFDIVNTVFVENGEPRFNGFGGIRVRSLGSRILRRSTIINTTFFRQEGLTKRGQYYTTLFCDVPVGDRLIVFNSLFLHDRGLLRVPEEHYVDPDCGSQFFSLASDDPALIVNDGQQLTSKPSLFVSPQDLDLRLLVAQTPDLNAVSFHGKPSLLLGSQKVVAPDHDLLGRSRLRSRLAIGALEPLALEVY